MPKRRDPEVAEQSAGGEMPERLARFRVEDWSDKDEPVPDFHLRDDVIGGVPYYGTRQEQAAMGRRLSAWRRWGRAQGEWAAAHGWTRRQLCGFRHPEWVAHGWADPPPDQTP